jgi:hypothetical protein
MKPKTPQPHFEPCAWYEQVAQIMRTDPKRFFVFSPQTKYALSIYLEMKERAEQKARLAA